MKRLLLLVMIGCGGSGPPAPVSPVSPISPTEPPRVATGPLDLTVRMRAERDKRKFGVAIDDALKSGDYVELFVHVSAPAYVYVVQFFPDGTSAVLFPAKGDRLVQPGNEFRIPERDEVFQLDTTLGVENIYVLASREPVRSADASIADQIESIRTSGDPPPANPPPANPPPANPPPANPPANPPPANPLKTPPPVVAKRPLVHRPNHLLTLATRGTRKVLTVKSPDGPAMKATAAKGDGSLLVVRFSFRHE